MDYVSKNNLIILSIGLFFLYLTYKSENTKIVKVAVNNTSIKKSPTKDEKKEDKKEEKRKEEHKEEKKEERKREEKKEEKRKEDNKKSPKKDDVAYISNAKSDD